MYLLDLLCSVFANEFFVSSMGLPPICEIPVMGWDITCMDRVDVKARYARSSICWS